MASTEIKVSKIRIDGNTQPRTKIDLNVVADYCEAIEMGENLPPVEVFHDGKEYWLADGFHRYHATCKANRKEIECHVHKGTQRDAILYSVGANSNHGLRRTNEDKRAAVMTLLNDPEWSKWSAREIARACAVSHNFANELRSSVSSDDTEKPDRVKYTTKHGTESTQKTDKKKADKPNATPAVEPPAEPVATVPAVEYGSTFDPTTFDAELNPSLQRVTVDRLTLEEKLVEQPKMIEAFCRAVRKHFDDNMPTDPLLDEATLTIAGQQLTSLLNTLRQRKAYGRCPKCPGDINPKCGFCKGHGYVTRTTFEMAGGVK